MAEAKVRVAAQPPCRAETVWCPCFFPRFFPSFAPCRIQAPASLGAGGRYHRGGAGQWEAKGRRGARWALAFRSRVVAQRSQLSRASLLLPVPAPAPRERQPARTVHRPLVLFLLPQLEAVLVPRVKRNLPQICVSAGAAPARSPRVDATSALAKPVCGSAGAARVQPAFLGRRGFTFLIRLKNGPGGAQLQKQTDVWVCLYLYVLTEMSEAALEWIWLPGTEV